MDGHRHAVTLAVLDGQGHDAISPAPELLVTQLEEFLS